MFGKGAVIYVAGLAILFAGYQVRLNGLAARVSDSFVQHYIATLNHEAAISGMNLGINKVWHQEVQDNVFTLIVPPCTTVVTISTVGEDTVSIHSKSVTTAFDGELYVNSGLMKPVLDSAFASFTFRTPITQFSSFTSSDAGLDWSTGDTAWTPVHVNHILRTLGSPVFYGKVTARLGISPDPSTGGSNAQFLGGWEVGIDTPMPNDQMGEIHDAATLGNDGAPVNTKCIYDRPLTLKFQADGTVIRTVEGFPTDTVFVADITPTGVLVCSEDIRISGVLNGFITLHSDDDIWIDDDVTFANDPLEDPSSDDMLGLTADNDIILTANEANYDNLTLYGCIFANGSFYAENYNGRPPSGILKLVGSVAQRSKGSVGAGPNNAPEHGFTKSYYGDSRLTTTSPPEFPYIRALRLISWWE